MTKPPNFSSHDQIHLIGSCQISIYSQLSLNGHFCKTDTWRCISDRDQFFWDDGFIIFYCFKYDAWSVLFFAVSVPTSSQVQRTLSDNTELDMRNLEIACNKFSFITSLSLDLFSKEICCQWFDSRTISSRLLLP